MGHRPSVGVRDENGDINRSQLSVMNGCVLMQDSDKHEEGWDFLKWWMSEDTQVEYTREMYLRNGPEYIWNTANLKALAKSTAFEPEDLQIILEQIDQTVEVPAIQPISPWNGSFPTPGTGWSTAATPPAPRSTRRS